MIAGADCVSCVLWEMVPELKAGGRRLGECRARGPSLTMKSDGRFATKWPMTREDQWCGEHATTVEPDDAA